MKYEIQKTLAFEEWLQELKDLQGKMSIIRRIDRARGGNLGDCNPVGSGISEMKVNIGPGYRIYYVI